MSTECLFLDAARAEPDAGNPGTCPRCSGKGYYRKDAFSFFACTCPASVARRQDVQGDQDAKWSDEHADARL